MNLRIHESEEHQSIEVVTQVPFVLSAATVKQCQRNKETLPWLAQDCSDLTNRHSLFGTLLVERCGAWQYIRIIQDFYFSLLLYLLTFTVSPCASEMKEPWLRISGSN